LGAISNCWKGIEVKILEDPPLEVESKLPWFVEVLVYPASLHGLIQIGIFVVAYLVVDLTQPIMIAVFRHYGQVVVLGLRILLVGYVTFYFGYCIYDSSRGGRRAPNIAVHHVPDKGDFVSQIGLILGCVAVCFWPVGLYYGFTERTDSAFWLLAACGGFFFPMALLAGILFDATHALNPIFIVVSVLRTFFAYWALILSFCVFGGLVAAVFWILSNIPILSFVSSAVGLYLLLVAAHLLGRFYWWNKYKLNWGL